MILLKNEKQILPLDTKKSIAVIGDFAFSPRYQGAGSSMVNPTKVEDMSSILQQYDLNLSLIHILSIQRPGTHQPKIYDGEKAAKDTAYEVRRARNQGIFVIGIFVGNEEELSVEKRIYGKDFAYILSLIHILLKER